MVSLGLRRCLGRSLALIVVAISLFASAVASAKACEDVLAGKLQAEAYRTVDLQAEVDASGLTPYLPAITAHAKGVMDIYDFMKIWPEMKSGYLLGLSERNLIYGALSSPMGLLGWVDGYSKHRIYPKAMNHTQTYMETIAATGEPIVFIVPRDLMSRESITQREMSWLLAHPEANLKNVYFVFGAYDFVSPEELARLNRLGHTSALREVLRKLANGETVGEQTR